MRHRALHSMPLKDSTTMACIIAVVLSGYLSIRPATALIGMEEGDAPKEITLNDLNGKTVRVTDFFGKKPVILVFWELALSDSFLDYSIEELRFLNDFYGKHHEKKGFEIFAIYTPVEDKEIPDEEIAKVQGLVLSNKIAFPVLIDRGLRIFREYGVIALPSTIMVGRTGKIEYIYPSFPLAARQVISDQIATLIGVSPSRPEQKTDRSEQAGSDPKSHRLYQYSLQMYRNGLDEQAFSALNKALATDKTYSWAHNLKGIILWNQGNSTGAAEEFKRAIALDNNIAAHLNYAILLSDQGHYREAEEIIKSASYTRVDYKVRAHYLLGLAYKDMDKNDMAIGELELAESLFEVWASENENSHFYTFSYRIPILRDLSALYSRTRQDKKAMERLQKAVKIALSYAGSEESGHPDPRRGYMVYE